MSFCPNWTIYSYSIRNAHLTFSAFCGVNEHFFLKFFHFFNKKSNFFVTKQVLLVFGAVFNSIFWFFPFFLVRFFKCWSIFQPNFFFFFVKFTTFFPFFSSVFNLFDRKSNFFVTKLDSLMFEQYLTIFFPFFFGLNVRLILFGQQKMKNIKKYR